MTTRVDAQAGQGDGEGATYRGNGFGGWNDTTFYTEGTTLQWLDYPADPDVPESLYLDDSIP